MSISFQKATKQQLPARVALAAPTGAGKTWTSLGIASVFGDRTVLIDTEKGSGALYADEFEYDYYRFDAPYAPSRLTEIIRDADAQGYDTVIIDSLSHFWEGEGGTLDIVDAAAQRSNGNSYAGWKVGTPELRHLVDAMLDLRSHLIVTMRSKMEYILQETTNSRGRTVTAPTKVGMAPVMRAGVEYEFTIVGDMDLEHRITISKSRCSALADQVIQPHREKEMAEIFIKWLRSGEAAVSVEQVEQIRAVLDGIDSEHERSERRNDAKRLWKDDFGDPQRLLVSQFDRALARAQELADSIMAEGAATAPTPAVATQERLITPPLPENAQTDALTNLEFALQALDESIQGAVRAEIRKTFGEPYEMEVDEIRAALKMVEDWPKGDPPAPVATGGAQAPVPPKRSGKQRGLLAYARGKALDEQQVRALASFLANTREPRPIEELDDAACKSMTSLIDDVVTGRLVFETDSGGLVVKEVQPA